MTQLGKILVFATLVLSIVMAGWALGLYANRVDWSSNEGEVPRKNRRAKELWDRLGPAEARWKASRGDLAARETPRSGNLIWYAGELNKLRNSPQPVQTSVYDPRTAALVLDRPFGVPTLEDAKDYSNQPLKSLTVYGEELRSTGTAIDGFKAEIEKLVKQNKAYTDQLNSDKDRKGLRERLDVEQKKLKEVIEELENLKRLSSNAEVDAERLLRRQKELLARVEELLAGP